MSSQEAGMYINTQNLLYKNVNLQSIPKKSIQENQIKQTEEQKYISSPLVDSNYGKLLVNRKNVSFKGVEAAVHPIESKISKMLLVLMPDEVALVGNNFEHARKLLSETVDKLDFVVKRLYFIEEKDAKNPFALTVNNLGCPNIFNVSKTPVVIMEKPKPIDPEKPKMFKQVFAIVNKGEKCYTVETDTIHAGALKFQVKNVDEGVSCEDLDFIKEYDFSDKSTGVINSINKKHLDMLAEEKEGQNVVKKLSFADVGGQDHIISELKKGIIFPLKYPQAFKNSIVNKGTILFGDPGTGKSLLGEVVANEIDAYYMKFMGSELEQKWVGVTEENWRNAFAEARAKQPSIMFIDEFDSVAKKRAGTDTSRYDDKTVNQILSLMSDLEKSDDQVHVIVATNKLELLDDAIIRSGRFGKHLEVKKPDFNGCKHIFKIHSKNKPVSEELDVDEFAKKLHKQSVSGADIAAIVNNAHSNAFDRAGIFEKMENETFQMSDIEKLRIEPVDFEKALDSFVKSNKALNKNPLGFRQEAEAIK